MASDTDALLPVENNEGPADTSSPTRKRSRLDAPTNEDDTSPALAAASSSNSNSSSITSAKTATTTLRATLLDPKAVEKLRDEYPKAPGYPHCVVKDVLDPTFFKGLRDEIVGSLSANFKETDLFKLYQTGDLANIDASDPEMAARLPHLIALRKAIYSPTFRQFVSEITGCDALTDRTDCSSNLYAQGSHLLCHDDVIGTRCVSFIIYLTDPDDAWEVNDGGSLEIYPLAKAEHLGVPAEVPVTAHLPYSNTMAFFTVLPGKSFHAVEEVYRSGKMRLSISGWYHAATPPEGKDMASLNQLQTRDNDDTTAAAGGSTDSALGIVPLDTKGGEEEQEEMMKMLLSKWIDKTYLSPGAMAQILAKFKDDGVVLLHNFLLPEIAKKMAAAAKEKDTAEKVGRTRKPEYEVGYGQGWVPVGPPHKQRYLRFAPTTVGTGETGEGEAEKEKEEGKGKEEEMRCPCGNLLAEIQNELFTSPLFARYLEKLTGVRAITGASAESRRFRPGLDYTLAHYGILTKEPKLDASLCCYVDDSTKKKEKVWASGDVGGFVCYIKADLGNEGAEAAESYRRPQTLQQQEDDDDVVSVFAASNTLSLVLRQTSAMRFVKYVSAAAPSSRWDVVAEYHLAQQQ